MKDLRCNTNLMSELSFQKFLRHILIIGNNHHLLSSAVWIVKNDVFNPVWTVKATTEQW